jgi:sugar lactone lactonase YvrE
MSWSPPHPTTPLVSLFSRSELTTVILNNYFGRQFNSLNDVAIHPRNKEMYFTDVTYGFLQDFRPAPVLPNQVYRFNPKTGLVSVVADGFDKPNGMSHRVVGVKADFQESHSRLMVLMPISPILVLRAVQKARTLISPLPCESYPLYK